MSIINRFTNILQNAVEALAPQASSIEEFIFHWKRITNYYIESADEKVCQILAISVKLFRSQ